MDANHKSVAGGGKPEDAAAYAEVTDRRVPEHEPFYAYGIYQLR